MFGNIKCCLTDLLEYWIFKLPNISVFGDRYQSSKLYQSDSNIFGIVKQLHGKEPMQQCTGPALSSFWLNYAVCPLIL